MDTASKRSLQHKVCRCSGHASSPNTQRQAIFDRQLLHDGTGNSLDTGVTTGKTSAAPRFFALTRDLAPCILILTARAGSPLTANYTDTCFEWPIPTRTSGGVAPLPIASQ